MKVVFIGDPVELEAGLGLSRVSTAMFGKIFPMGAEVDVSDLSQDQVRKLLGNPHFRESSVAASMHRPLIIPTSAAASAVDVGGDDDEAAAAAAHAERAAAKRKKA